MHIQDTLDREQQSYKYLLKAIQLIRTPTEQQSKTGNAKFVQTTT